MAGDFTVSTRDRPSALVGTALGFLPVGGTLNVSLKLQPVGTIKGVVYGIDGGTLQEGTQVRIVSRERGIITQAVTGPDGAFRFNPLPLSDGPFTLDTFADGRLRARIPGLVLSTPNQGRTENLDLTPRRHGDGLVSDATGQVYPGASVTLQMSEGLRFAFDVKADASGRFLFGGVPGRQRHAHRRADGRTGTAQGRVNADNESVTLNVQLATNSLIGTVFSATGRHRPRESPSISSRARRAHAHRQSQHGGGASTTTNALGAVRFPDPDHRQLHAAGGIRRDRGRTQVVITTIDPGTRCSPTSPCSPRAR